MAQRAKAKNKRNHIRQCKYLEKGVVMLPTLTEERKQNKKKS